MKNTFITFFYHFIFAPLKLSLFFFMDYGVFLFFCELMMAPQKEKTTTATRLKTPSRA